MPATQITRICIDGADTRPHLSRSDRARRCEAHQDIWDRHLVNRSKLKKKVEAGTAPKARLRELTAAYHHARDQITAQARPAPTASSTIPSVRTRADETAQAFTSATLTAWRNYQVALTRGRDARTRAAATDTLVRSIAKAVETYNFMRQS